VAGDPLRDLLLELADLLGECGERPWATRLAALAADLESAGDGRGRVDAARAVLALFGGMGSFSDLVLQDTNGVRVEQPRLDASRDRLFDLAREELA
jgi:hypothetical protein